MSDWKPMPKPGGKQIDSPDEATEEVRKRDLPGNALGPDDPNHRASEDDQDEQSLASEIRGRGGK